MVYTYREAVAGESIIIDWWDTNQNIVSLTAKDSQGSTLSYSRNDYWDDINHKNRQMTINCVHSDINVDVVYPSNVDWLFNSEHTPWMEDVWINGVSPEPEKILVDDTAFNNSDSENHVAVLVSPSWNKSWQLGEGKDFPAVDEHGLPYFYYVVEINEDGTPIPVGKKDKTNSYTLVRYSDNNTEGIKSQGTIEVYNMLESIPVDIEIEKIDGKTKKSIGGARFYLIRDNEVVTELDIISVSSKEKIVLDQENCFTIPEGGIQINQRNVGDYKLVEKEAPAGYVFSDGEWLFSVNGDRTISGDKDILSGLKLSIPNEPGKELPSTGGPGTVLPRGIGLLMVLSSAALLLKKRKIH